MWVDRRDKTEEQNTIVCGWIRWIQDKQRKRAMGGSRCHVSASTSHSCARGNPELIKTLINKAACSRGGDEGGAGEQINEKKERKITLGETGGGGQGRYSRDNLV